SVEANPAVSVTVSFAVYTPAAVYVWGTGHDRGHDPVVSRLPSPYDNRYEAMSLSGSELPEPLKLTRRGAVPDVGVAVRSATGGALGVAVTVAVATALDPTMSVTVRLGT